jgi:hypothetical protein
MVKEDKTIEPEIKDKALCNQNVFCCQSTSLMKASTPIPLWDFRHYLWEITSERNGGILAPLRIIINLFKARIAFITKLKKYRVRGERKRTPAMALNLKVGEIVMVKSREEIFETLDQKGRNRGLEFMPEMLKYCGKKFRVFKKVDRMILDSSGKMRLIPNTVILEGVICDGSFHRGCQRTCFCLWREIWLRRVEDNGLA